MKLLLYLLVAANLGVVCAQGGESREQGNFLAAYRKVRVGSTQAQVDEIMAGSVVEIGELVWGGSGARRRSYRCGNSVFSIELDGPRNSAKVTELSEVKQFKGWEEGVEKQPLPSPRAAKRLKSSHPTPRSVPNRQDNEQTR